MGFQYEPLDLTKPSIRLLKVLPRRDDGQIVCEITAVELPTTYAALSYNWGPPGDEHVITLVSSKTGQSGIARVRGNLFEFLSRASATEEYRRQRWWIDALCIDQVRVDERNHQVQQMDTIYVGAKRVHIWLGLDPLIARVFTLLHKYWKDGSKKSVSHDTFLKKVIHDRRCLEGISRLRTHPYWSRLWIIQEVLLSDELLIVAGHLSIPWDYLSILDETIQLADLLVDDPSATQNISAPSTAASNLRFLLTCRPRQAEQLPRPFCQEIDLLQLLEVATTSVCQDIRDKLYGLLALVRNSHRLPVDYHISVNDLFHRACSFYACWANPENGLGFVRRLADALEIDLQAMATASPSSVVHVFNIEPVELERRFGRGTARLICAQCGADLAWAASPSPQSDLVTRVWCLRMGTRPWLHVFFERDEPLNASTSTSQYSRIDKHEGGPQAVIRWGPDMLNAMDRDDCTQLSRDRNHAEHEWAGEYEFHVSQQTLLSMASLA